MGLFKSKEQKKQEKEMLIKKSMKDLEIRIKKLKAQENVYIDAAKIAMEQELQQQVELAKNALKMTIAEEKRTYQMWLNAKIISQMKDMSAMTGEFLKSVSVISKSIMGNMNGDMGKISTQLKMAMDQVSNQTENLEEMLENSQDTISDFASDTKLISDDEIDKMIYGVSKGEKAQGEGFSDKEINAELENMENLLNK